MIILSQALLLQFDANEDNKEEDDDEMREMIMVHKAVLEMVIIRK